MKKIGLLVYLLTNLYLIILYISEIRRYYLNTYNYDGFRYFMPIVTSNIFFLLSLFFLYCSLKSKRSFYCFLVLSILHNITIGLGVDNIPFVGLLIGFISVYHVLKNVFQ